MLLGERCVADIDSAVILRLQSQPTRSKIQQSKQSLRIQLYVELLILDCLAIIAAFVVVNRLLGTEWLSPEGVNLVFLALPTYLILAFNRNAYGIHVLKSRADSLRKSLGSLVLAMLSLLMLLFYARIGITVSRFAFTAGMLLSAVFLFGARYAFYRYGRARAKGAFTDEVLIVDSVAIPPNDCRCVIDARAEGIEPDLSNPGMLSRLATLLRHFDRVVIAAPAERQMAWSLLLKGANVSGEIILASGNGLGALGFSNFEGMDTLQVSRGPLSVTSRAKKRALDLAITAPALILLSPLLVLVAVLIKLDSQGPVFFRQPRVGRGNAMFEILKFRSMRTEKCDENGQRSTLRDDDRITRVGRFIRRTSIDELPQLLNVLRGDMSLVGPRPHALGSLAGDKLFWEVSETYWLRHALKPGITGLAQIRGFRGATHRTGDLESRLQADLEYVNGWRLWRDVTILFGTVAVIVHPNAY